jgi:hypothetical protein
LFCFLKRATGDAIKSLVVASLFAWHPINVETVTGLPNAKVFSECSSHFWLSSPTSVTQRNHPSAVWHW